MARYTGPKHKLARREGINILEKVSANLERRINVLPGSHGKRSRRKFSEYGIQLREKQKLKRIYGLLEKQFRKYVNHAQKQKGNTEEALITALETRLDNIVYRLGFAKSRAMARQMVGHKHVFVNGVKTNIPSYAVKPGDEITVDKEFIEKNIIKEEGEEEKIMVSYLAKDKEKGKVLAFPNSADVQNPVDYQLVIEFYSR